MTWDFCFSRKPPAGTPLALSLSSLLETTRQAALWDMLPAGPSSHPQYQSLTVSSCQDRVGGGKTRGEKGEENKDHTAPFSAPLLSAGPHMGSQGSSRTAPPRLPLYHTQCTGVTTSAERSGSPQQELVCGWGKILQATFQGCHMAPNIEVEAH